MAPKKGNCHICGRSGHWKNECKEKKTHMCDRCFRVYEFRKFGDDENRCQYCVLNIASAKEMRDFLIGQGHEKLLGNL